MYPLLIHIGSIHIYNLSVCLVLAWLTFSFVFWRSLRNNGVAEDTIFNLTFYSSLIAFVTARVVYVILNTEVFKESPLKIIALWITPGLSLYGAMFGALLTFVFLCRQYKVRVGYMLDAFGPAFGLSFIIGTIGSFLDGTYVGVVTNLPWAVRYVGHLGKRHPVQIYEILTMICILLFVSILSRRGVRKKWPYGLIGLWYFGCISVFMFILEFFKDTRVYWSMLRANQWFMVALFAETIGAFYVRGGGREAIRPFLNKIYAKFSKRNS